jgi:hypothetical protein
MAMSVEIDVLWIVPCTEFVATELAITPARHDSQSAARTRSPQQASCHAIYQCISNIYDQTRNPAWSGYAGQPAEIAEPPLRFCVT